MKHDVFDGLKIEALMEKLKIPRYAAAGILTGLWKVAQRFYPAGDIGKASNRQIAERLDWPVKKADILINALLETRWLDSISGGGRLYIHDWHEHCEDSVHRVLARKHLFFANGSTPNWRRLEKPYIYDAERFYTAKGVTTEICAESAPNICVPIPIPIPIPIPQPIPQPIPIPEPVPPADSALGSVSAESHPQSVQDTEPVTPRKRRPTTTPDATGKPTEDEVRRQWQQAAAAAEAGLPIPQKPGGAALPVNGTHATLTGILGSISTAPDPQASLDTLLQRIRRVTGDSHEDMAWWAAALPALTENATTAEVLHAALDYASDCADEATRALKGLGPLKNPGGYVTSKVLIAARAEKVAVPARPERAKANA